MADQSETTRAPYPGCGAFESAQEHAAEDRKRGTPWRCPVCAATVESKGCQRRQKKLPAVRRRRTRALADDDVSADKPDAPPPTDWY
jgi:hypothetical protein